MFLKTFTLTLASPRPILAPASELRGFFATKLQQHSADKLIYHYPLAQYRMIDGAPGISESAEVLEQIYDNYTPGIRSN